jgi:hypothetical protein
LLGRTLETMLYPDEYCSWHTPGFTSTWIVSVDGSGGEGEHTPPVTLVHRCQKISGSFRVWLTILCWSKVGSLRRPACFSGRFPKRCSSVVHRPLKSAFHAEGGNRRSNCPKSVCVECFHASCTAEGKCWWRVGRRKIFETCSDSNKNRSDAHGTEIR